MATPIVPVIPGFVPDEDTNCTEVAYTSTEPGVLPLPALIVENQVLSRWQLSEEEKALVAQNGTLYLWVFTHGHPLPPVLVTAIAPGFEQGQTPQVPILRSETSPLNGVAFSTIELFCRASGYDMWAQEKIAHALEEAVFNGCVTADGLNELAQAGLPAAKMLMHRWEVGYEDLLFLLKSVGIDIVVATLIGQMATVYVPGQRRAQTPETPHSPEEAPDGS